MTTDTKTAVPADPWPTSGPNFNAWNEDAAAFTRIIQDAPTFWGRDFDLKYLSLRIDTRSGHFVLSDRNGKVISPDRVLAAISREKARHAE